jgi:hypothetical protein
MALAKFATIAEQRSAELADSLVGKLMTSSATEQYGTMDETLLREDFRTLFASLTDWLLRRTKAEIEERFAQLGRQRAKQCVPLVQCVNALLVCRDHLLESLRHQAEDVDFYAELEFAGLVEGFFEDAIFFSMRGYRRYELAAEAVA